MQVSPIDSHSTRLSCKGLRAVVLVLLSVIISSGPVSAAEELTKQQLALLEYYKYAALLCEKSPLCRKRQQELVNRNEPSFLQREVNLKLMEEDFIR